MEQAGGDALPVADPGPAGAAAQFVGEGGQRDDLALPASLGEEVVDAGAVGLAQVTRGAHSALVRAGARFERGPLVERPEAHAA